MNSTTIHRILIVDDNLAIHEDFKKVLLADAFTEIDASEARLFGEVPPVATIRYELDFAFQGEEGLTKVGQALNENRPFSMAFVDMRMPPGWDGVETISRIWLKDPDIQIALCTAYSDYSWHQILDRLGRSDRLLILKKPFDTAEIRQIACALTSKWTLARQANLKTIELETLMRDRTAELVAVNAELKLSNQQLREFYEMESERNHLRDSVKAMEQVLGVVGHELRTPIGAIRGWSETLSKTLRATDPTAGQMLDGIVNTTQEMAQTLDNLLEAVRLNSGLADWNWSSFALKTVCDQAIRMVRPVVPGEELAVQLFQNVDPDDAVMSGDHDAVRRLLVNLLRNAIRNTTAGQIVVTAQAQTDSEGDWIDLAVSDTGCGIPPEILARIGEPFALSRGAVGEYCVQGAGMGTSICRAIAAAHGGFLMFESVMGTGTTVTVHLRRDLLGPALPNTGSLPPTAHKNELVGAGR